MLSLQKQTVDHHNFFQEELFQKSAYINKALIALYKINGFQTSNDLDYDISKLTCVSKSIAGHYLLASNTIDKLLHKLPENDPLMLHMQLSDLQPRMESIREKNNTFYNALENVDSVAGIEEILSSNQNHIHNSIEVLEEYQNLYPQIESNLFSNQESNIQNILSRLNSLFYVLAFMFILTLALSLSYVYANYRMNHALVESSEILESKVKERTLDLKSTNERLANEIKEREHLEYEVRLKSDALENSLNAFDIVDQDQKFIYVNKTHLKMWGYDTRDEVIGRSPLLHFQEPKEGAQFIAELRKNGSCVKELVARRKDGSLFDLLLYGRLAYDDSGREIYPTSSIDISERKRMEKELVHAQKMESVGNLAGGVAHEFNNVLAIIVGNNEILLSELQQESTAVECAEEIKIACVRAKDIVKQLLTFSRQDDSALHIIKLNAVVEEAVMLIRSFTPRNIEINLTLSEQSFSIYGNATQINQLLINICGNSIDALPENGGVITVDLTTETIEDSSGIGQHIKSGEYAKLVISDNGFGMEKETLNRIFDPFYTTKDVGRGSGIGMAVVHGIVKQHNGLIQAESESGKGTVLTIYFPAHEEGMAPVEEEAIDLANRAGTILIVDDEQSITKLLKRLLDGSGYRVETENDPIDALANFRQDPGRYDLVISDMAMANMTGKSMLLEMKKINPHVKTIICTGYSDQLSSEEAVELGIDAFAMKPLDKSTLEDVICSVLGNKGRTGSDGSGA